MDLLSVPVALFVVILALLYHYATRNFSYWKDRGVTFIKPYPLFGSLFKVFTKKEHMADFFGRIAKKYKGKPFIGYFQGSSPGLIVMDPELVKNIIIKDFSYFMDHGRFTVDEETDPMTSKNLFNMEGKKWKEMRSKLSPTFTSEKMKNMFPLVEECANNLANYIAKHQGENIEIKELFARFTTDIIGSCAFGINVNSVQNPNAQFRVMGRKIFEFDFIKGVKNSCLLLLPTIAKLFKFRFFEEDVTQFFRGLVNEIVEKRRIFGNTRKDFMQLLIQLKEKGRLKIADNDTPEHINTNSNFDLSNDDIVAQAVVFFVAGFETTSTALSYSLMEIARSPLVQEKARKNIEEVLKRHNGVMSYQAIQEMTYLDWILKEALRMYPPVAVLPRKTTKNYIIPGTKVSLEKGTLVVIPVKAMQSDPDYYDKPDEFIPERFADEEQNHKNQFIFMPFGEGPRQCIGMRFAKLQSKMVLCSILRKFDVLESVQTTYPPHWNPQMFIMVSKYDIFVKVKAIS